MSHKDTTTVLVLDTETTGTRPWKGDQIIEVACATLDMLTWEVRSPWAALIVGGDRIQGDYHLKNGTFRDVDWSGAISRQEAIGTLFRRMEGQTVAGHNVAFDLDFLRAEARALGFNYPGINYHRVDSMYQAMPLLQSRRVENLKLETLRTWAGQSGKQAHRAMGDVYDCIAVMKKLTRAMTLGLETMEAFG